MRSRSCCGLFFPTRIRTTRSLESLSPVPFFGGSRAPATRRYTWPHASESSNPKRKGGPPQQPQFPSAKRPKNTFFEGGAGFEIFWTLLDSKSWKNLNSHVLFDPVRESATSIKCVESTSASSFSASCQNQKAALPIFWPSSPSEEPLPQHTAVPAPYHHHTIQCASTPPPMLLPAHAPPRPRRPSSPS